ncbi:MAG: hypothetical protein R3270_03640 [Gammaproteobacteria bacterium]|nr:hypothetical protein [Gammaproteobacteria bacterium]
MSRSYSFARSRTALHGLALASVSFLVSPAVQAEIVEPGSLSGAAEFLMETDTTTPGIYPGVSVGTAADGSFVLAYQVIEEGHEVYAQRFNADGSAKGDAFRVNTSTIYHQYEPSVAMAPDGAFAIAWHSTDAYYTDPHGYHAYSQAYDAEGNPVGGEVDIPNQDLRWGEFPKAAMAPDHSYVVVWNGGMGVYAHRFDANGNTVGSVIEVAPHIEWAGHADVAMNTDGSFLVAWRDEDVFSVGDGDGAGVMVSKYNADGTLAFGPTRVNVTTAGNQQRPAIAAAMDGSFIVTFDNISADPQDINVLGRAFTADGTPVGDEFLVNQTEASEQLNVDLTATADGYIVAMWVDSSQSDAMMVRTFEADGTPVTSEAALSLEHVNTSRDGSISANANGDTLAVWAGSDRDVYTRVIAGASVDLSVSLTGGGSEIDQGESETFTVALTNVSLPAATGVTAIDAERAVSRNPQVEVPLGSGMSLIGHGGAGWNCSETAGVVSCQFDTALKSGESSDDLSLEIGFANAGESSVTVEGSDGKTGEIDVADNSASASITVNAVGGDSGGGSAGFALLAALGLFRLRRRTC